MVFCPLQCWWDSSNECWLFDQLLRNIKRCAAGLSFKSVPIYLSGWTTSFKNSPAIQDCKGIPLPNHQEVKISQFTDDTTLIMSDTNSLKIALQTVDNFGTVSGLKLNKKKKPKRCGSAPQNRKNITILEFSVTKDPIKILGTYLSHNRVKNISANFHIRIRKLSPKFNLWRARELTLCGKSLLAKTLGAS